MTEKLNEDKLKSREEDMLKGNWKGHFCWIDGKLFCQEGYCSECAIYLDWKENLRKVSVK